MSAAARSTMSLQVAAALLLLFVPLLGSWFAHGLAPGRPAAAEAPSRLAARARPAPRPPPVEPATIRDVPPDAARAINAKIPFSTAPNPAARAFFFQGTAQDRDRAIDCLAAAQYYEAGNDPLGQRAVAQVVINRLRHPAFPKSVCAVVFQGAERITGCQFTFTCDGALARRPSAAAWAEARKLAARMLSGEVEPRVGHATHYHTDWVVPYWSASLEKITEVHSHLFFRWPGWWGTPGAFLRRVETREPGIPLIAALSPVHANGGESGASPTSGLPAPRMLAEDARALAGAPPLFVAQGAEKGRAPSATGPVRLVAASPAQDAFIVELPDRLADEDYPAAARTFCAGRVRCRVMGWRAGASPPGAFPVPRAALASMLFSYIHDAESGLQRLLWNCDLMPQANPRNCMRERIPVGQLSRSLDQAAAAR